MSECKICSNSFLNQSYVIKERMLGLMEEFTYFQCSQCGCLQITDIPDSMASYYPKDKYYSYKAPQMGDRVQSLRSKIGLYFRRKLVNSYFGKPGIAGWLAGQTRYLDYYLNWLALVGSLEKNAEILDVGCGAGTMLLELNQLGFINLTGIDPYLENDLAYESGVNIYKKDIYSVDQQFDLISLHHSFEHMDDPYKVLDKLFKLLKTNGQVVISIPQVDCFAWRKYGVNWYQIDAPRHFFLYSKQSMNILAQRSGFEIKSIRYNSNESQFRISEKYQQGKLMFDEIDVDKSQITEWRTQARLLNKLEDGDQAYFLLRKVG